jgi:hypothetical protein
MSATASGAEIKAMARLLQQRKGNPMPIRNRAERRKADAIYRLGLRAETRALNAALAKAAT